MCVEAKSHRDRGRDRDKERRKGNSVEKERRKRRFERVRSIDSEDECHRYVGEKREKRKEKEKDRRRSGSEEGRDRYKRRTKENGREHRERERYRCKDRKRDREGNAESGDDVKRDMKRRRQEDNGEKKAREDEAEDVHKEVEKQRRRLHEWQELKRKKEEIESKSKSWTLEGESDDEQGPPQIETDVHGDSRPKMVDMEKAVSENEEVIDPLDAFMNTIVLPEVEKLSNAASSLGVSDVDNKALGWIIQGEDSDSDYPETKNDDDHEDKEDLMKRIKKTKGDKLSLIDHSKTNYEPFRKNFYIQVKNISNMTQEEVNTYRKELEIKVHGKDVPRPIKSWHQTGLTNKILNTIKKLNFEKPTPVQAQSLPIIMSGRDCIAVAATGSGKTLGFVLPMLRHIKDQPPVESGDGPIGLVMAPTRELVQQIHSDIKKFAKSLSIRSVAVYGGSGVSQQISELRRGTEIIVCTPGRMIDILCTNSGRVTNLQRVTFLVMDEADRMFDMGFEPQITRIIQNIRPDRQTVLFSATFPRQVEVLARRVLNKPVEIQAGGRSVVNKDITQFVEIKQESEKRPRLVELIEEWYERGKILVFVGSQEKCDGLYNDLKEKCGYRCQSLHGGKDQMYRELAISEFKSSVCNLLVATSVAARGLDVKELELVVNFDAPNHYEEYVHRVGRTGRAGRKGCAVTFVSEEDAKYAPDLVKALERSEQVVPDGLKAMADGFMERVRQGVEKRHGSGFGGSGFKFNEEEDVRRAAKEAQEKEYGVEEEEEDKSELEDGEISQQKQQATMVVAAMLRGCARPQQQRYEAELEINDFPQNARRKVTRRETLGSISDWSGAAITTRGQFFTPGRVVRPGERKLYLFIEGPSEESVKAAKAELRRVVNDITSQALSFPGRSKPGRYSVF